MWAALLVAVAWAAPVIEWVEPAEAVAPGTIVNARVRVQASEAVVAAEELRLPEGWESVFPLGDVSLQPGETSLRMLALRPTRRAPAGPAEIAYGLRRPDGTVASRSVLTLDVLEHIELESHVRHPPEILRHGDEASAEVTLLNRGNATAQVSADAACSSLNCQLTPRSAWIGPGETETFELALSSAGNRKASGPASAVVTLRGGDAVERVVVTVQVVSPKAAPLERERLRGHLSIGGSSSMLRSEASGALGLRGHLAGSQGPLVGLSLRGLATNDAHRVFEGSAIVELDALRLRADTALPSPSVLLRPGAGVGADLRVTAGPWFADGGMHRDRRLTDTFAWTRVGAQANGWSARVLAAGTSGSLGRAWVATQLAYQGEGGSHATAELATHPQNGAMGMRLGVGTNPDGSVHVDAHHERATAGFRDERGHASTRGRVTVTKEGFQAAAFARDDREGSRSSRRLGVGLRWRKDQERWSANGSLDGTWRKQVDDEGRLQLWEADGKGRVRFQDHEASGRVVLSLEPVEGWARLETTLQLGIGSTRHRVTALAKADTRTDASIESRFELAGHTGTENVDVVLGGQTSFGKYPMALAQAAFGYRFAKRTRVQGEFRVGRQSGEALRGFRVNWTTPLTVASGPATDLGTLRGRIYEHDAPDVGVSGVLVVLGDRSALTRTDGSFRLRGVSTGEGLVYLDLGERGEGLISTEPMPMPITVLEDGNQVLEVGLARAASVEGTLVFARGGMGGGLGAGPNLDDGPLRDVLIELTRGRERLLRRTGRDGEFAFRGLRPGEWSLTVHTGGLPVEVEIVDRVRMLTIEGGSLQTIEVHARPAPRAMEIQQGFTLTP
ncbi:MAG: hypothetical protein KC912_23705 [Proteobacteria bacterium]|nr:hypothetical protein [Pseudomonadota bacterium]